jgi:hypothetical protein
MIEPAAQRFPSPNAAPAPELCCAVPWKYSAELFGIRVPNSTKLSAVTRGTPLDRRRPPVPSEFRQPSWSTGALAFPHGHAVPLPSPGQKIVTAVWQASSTP